VLLDIEGWLHILKHVFTGIKIVEEDICSLDLYSETVNNSFFDDILRDSLELE